MPRINRECLLFKKIVVKEFKEDLKKKKFSQHEFRNLSEVTSDYENWSEYDYFITDAILFKPLLNFFQYH